jgi:membrane-bound ClpP family serine protease
VGPLVIAVIGAMAWTVYKGIKAMDDRPIGDIEEHIGKVVQAAGALKPSGKVVLEGTFWNAVSTKPVADGASVRIIGADGLTLRVEPAEET